ncbi:hypothetical protein HCDG_07163 [Histoplasma capsulatum H143]|uniref:Uncharacterized protein n=1 Tax=Ajellomyces capsulatus (strain H143) TaxID=544712 RepID=C6HM47_AJECH|nr:hypothetical protein HCDG_07163 [Histoplasma capsulatum H143]
MSWTIVSRPSQDAAVEPPPDRTTSSKDNDDEHRRDWKLRNTTKGSDKSGVKQCCHTTRYVHHGSSTIIINTLSYFPTSALHLIPIKLHTLHIIHSHFFIDYEIRLRIRVRLEINYEGPCIFVNDSLINKTRIGGSYENSTESSHPEIFDLPLMVVSVRVNVNVNVNGRCPPCQEAQGGKADEA